MAWVTKSVSGDCAHFVLGPWPAWGPCPELCNYVTTQGPKRTSGVQYVLSPSILWQSFRITLETGLHSSAHTPPSCAVLASPLWCIVPRALHPAWSSTLRPSHHRHGWLLASRCLVVSLLCHQIRSAVAWHAPTGRPRQARVLLCGAS